jgi:hypothetical protein
LRSNFRLRDLVSHFLVVVRHGLELKLGL